MNATIPNPPSLGLSLLSYKWFKMIVKGNELKLCEEDALNFVKNDLKFNLKEMDEMLVSVVPYMVAAFIKKWPGWKLSNQLESKKFVINHCYARFHKYLAFKILYSLRETYNSVISEMKRTNPHFNPKTAVKIQKDDALNQSVAGANKELKFAPYTLLIKCPPNMLNTMAFGTTENDVIVKQHIGREWVKLTTTQLINWPNIKVTFIMKDLMFTRSLKPDYLRYLDSAPVVTSIPDQETICSIKDLSGGKIERTAYSLTLLNTYVDEYVKALRSTKRVKRSRLEEIQSVFYQFLEDIRYMDIEDQTIADNTSILFNLTRSPYIRCQKLFKTDQKSSTNENDDWVSFCEKITPRIELELQYFKGVQNIKSVNNSTNTFRLTERILSRGIQMPQTTLDSLLPQIIYKCLFCNQDFSSLKAKNEICDHYIKNHKMEQPVRCTKCNIKFDVMALAVNRWKHTCEPAPSTSKVANVTS